MYTHYDNEDELFQERDNERYALTTYYPEKRKKKKGKATIIILSITLLAASSFGGGFLSSKLLSQNDQSTVTPSVTKSADHSNNLIQTSVTNNNKALSVVDIANINGNSVVEIVTEVMTTSSRMQQYISEGAGSGVIITADGYIATNNHVIENANKITVRLKNGESYPATLIGKDAQTDIAVIKIETSGLQAVTFGDSSKLQVGELAVAIGNPLGQLGGTVTDGIISALDREITLDNQTMNLLQTNAAINPGNSGGGLFNDGGELVGLVVAKSAGSNIEGIGFAIPSNDVETVVNQLIAHGYVTGRPSLGVSLLDIDSPQTAMMYRVNQIGVYIAQVTPGSAADKAGLQVGDCVVSVNNTAISTSSELKKVIQDNTVGAKLTLKILRNTEELTIPVELAEANPLS